MIHTVSQGDTSDTMTAYRKEYFKAKMRFPIRDFLRFGVIPSLVSPLSPVETSRVATPIITGPSGGTPHRGCALSRDKELETSFDFWRLALAKRKPDIKENQVNKAGLAQIFGISATTVDNWLRHGCPVLQAGRAGRAYRFDTAAVFAWYVERLKAKATPSPNDPLEAARIRKLEAQAEVAEIEAAHRRGEIALIEDVAEAVGQVFDRVRTKLLALPSKAAPMVVRAGGLAQARDVLDGLIYEALAELADHGEPPYCPETPGVEAGPGTNL
jgi:phage terminase Nu1 subunit (DNA packaging protein)